MNRFSPSAFLLLIVIATTSMWAAAQGSDPASFLTAISKVVTEDNGKSICPPPGTALINFFPPLKQYMGQHPEKQNLTEFDIHQALSQGFPCPPGSSTQKKIEALREQGYSVKSITPVFSQLVMFSFPKGFTTVFEDTKNTNYIRESVLAGESVKKWSQMVTLTGAKGLASNPNALPQTVANAMAGGIRNACPTSFAGTGLGAFKVGGIYDAFAAFVSCGVAKPAGDTYSESFLLIVIKGESDFYTIQWAERGESSTTPIKYDEAKWGDRIKRLGPIKLCPVVPGESAPYPSCVGT